MPDGHVHSLGVDPLLVNEEVNYSTTFFPKSGKDYALTTMDCSFLRASRVSSGLVLAGWLWSSWCFRWFQTFSSGFQSGEYFGK